MKKAYYYISESAPSYIILTIPLKFNELFHFYSIAVSSLAADMEQKTAT
jgi:hypothetical protein